MVDCLFAFCFLTFSLPHPPLTRRVFSLQPSATTDGISRLCISTREPGDMPQFREFPARERATDAYSSSLFSRT
jgi:hypothetical protein